MINIDYNNLNNGLSLILPPVLPCELAKIDMRIFAKLIQNHYLHLVTPFNDPGLERISQEFCEFQHAFYEEVEEFKEAIKLTENDAVSMAFKQLWMPTNNYSLWLQSLCGG